MPLFSNRPDGVLLTQLPGFRKIFPFVMPTRTEAYIHYQQKIRVKKALDFLTELNQGRMEQKYSFFHIVLAACVRLIALRPDAHRFVSGRRIYQRRYIEFSFIMKKQLTDTAAEANIKIRFEPTDTLETVAGRVWQAVSKVKKTNSSYDEDLCELICKLPRFMTRLAMWVWKVFDYFNLLPASVIHSDPLYCSVYLANLGSIGLNVVQHHLFEWGTCPFFVVIGKVHKDIIVSDSGAIIVEDIASASFTLDERITDGVCYAQIIGLLMNLIEDPRQLAKPPESLPDPYALV
jgi:hypothetical protein